MESIFSIKETIDKYIEECHKKNNMPITNLLVKAVMAGVMIAMGAAISNVAAHTISDVGVARLAAAVVFPVGLMMVVLLGAELFTGDCLAVMSVFDGKQKIRSCLKLLVLVYIGNFVGAALTALLISMSGQFDFSVGMLGAYTIKVAVEKVNISFAQGIVSGILCNILVCAAVLMAARAKDITGKIFAVFFMIMLFVTGGFEHCVANMYYITAGLFAVNDPEYVALAKEAYGFSQEYLNTLSISNFFAVNLLPVTIGNIIGGALGIGAPMYFLNRKK